VVLFGRCVTVATTVVGMSHPELMWGLNGPTKSGSVRTKKGPSLNNPRTLWATDDRRERKTLGVTSVVYKYQGPDLLPSS
jgi:hypothetical protein